LRASRVGVSKIIVLFSLGICYAKTLDAWLRTGGGFGCLWQKEEPVAAAPAAPAAAQAAAEEKVLNIYNWPDYIAKDMVENFEKSPVSK